MIPRLLGTSSEAAAFIERRVLVRGTGGAGIICVNVGFPKRASCRPKMVDAMRHMLNDAGIDDDDARAGKFFGY